MASQQKHIVGHAAAAWGQWFDCMLVTASSLRHHHRLVGHTRPLINLSARMAKLRSNVYVTLLTTDAFYDRVKHELARSFDSLDEEPAQRIRFVHS